MKFLLTSLMVTIFYSQSIFATSTLREITDSYQYAVDVEWDQKDQKFLEAANEKMKGELEQLIQSGVSKEELLNQAMEAIPDAKMKSEVKKNFQALSAESISAEQFQKSMQDIAGMRTSGAHWSPVGSVLVGTAAVLAVSYLAFRIYFHEWGKRL